MTSHARPAAWPIAIMVAALACAGGNGLSEADRTEIRRLDSAYVDAWLRGDTAAVLGTLLPDAVLMPAGQRPLTDAAAIRGFWWPTDGSRTRVTAYTTTIEEIGGDAAVAYVRGTGRLAFTYQKDSVESQLTSTSMSLTVMMRDSAGRWRIARRMWGPLAP